MKRIRPAPWDKLIQKIYATCRQMPPGAAATLLDVESRAYIGELLLARAIVTIRALTPKEKLPAGAHDPYLLTDLAELVNEFARLDLANLPGKLGRPKKTTVNHLRKLSLELKEMYPRVHGRPSKVLQDESFMRAWKEAKSGLESAGKKAALLDIANELARAQIHAKGRGSSASLLNQREKNIENYRKVRARMRQRKHRA